MDVIGRILVVESIKFIMVSLIDGDLLKMIEELLEGDFKVFGEFINYFIGELCDIIVKIYIVVEIIDMVLNEIVIGNVDLFSCIEQ